jgi:hypothetical protein
MIGHKKKPGAARRRASGAFAGSEVRAHLSTSALACRSDRVPPNWRGQLPDSRTYYVRHVGKLIRANADGWAQGKCPFHDDHNASLSVKIVGPHSGWRCFAGCGKGDMVAFHMRLRGCAFKQAISELVRGGA